MKNWALTQSAPLVVPQPLFNGKLVSYYLFTRHGARAPLFNWSDYPIENLKWDYGQKIEAPHRIPIVNGKKFNFSNVPQKSRLLFSGVKQQENLGKLYQNYLLNQNNFQLDFSQIYVRSSVIPRAIESAFSFLNGMYKPTKSTEKLFIETGQFGSEILCPNPDLNDFFKGKAKEYSKTVEFKERIDLIPSEIKNVIPDNQVDQLLAGDFPYCLQFNGFKLPKQIEDDNKRFRMMMNDSKSDSLGSLFYFLNTNIAFYVTGFIDFVGKKAFGPIVNLFADHLKKFLDRKTDVKFTLFSGHDVTLSAFLLAFGIKNNDGVPPYASHLAAELWERDNKLVLRFVMNGEVLNINNSDTVGVDDFLKKYID